MVEFRTLLKLTLEWRGEYTVAILGCMKGGEVSLRTIVSFFGTYTLEVLLGFAKV